MIKPVRAAGQSRDEAVQAEEASNRPQWQPRKDGLKALLVNERTTVFDRPAAIVVQAVDQLDGIADPEGAVGPQLVWTSDYVHCRLLVCGATIAALPPGLRRGYVNQATNFAISEAAAPKFKASPSDISVLDWTWPQLVKFDGEGKPQSTLQRVLMASAFGGTLSAIVDTLIAEGIPATKPTIGRQYLAERRRLATLWQNQHHPIDGSTERRWFDLFDKARK